MGDTNPEPAGGVVRRARPDVELRRQRHGQAALPGWRPLGVEHQQPRHLSLPGGTAIDHHHIEHVVDYNYRLNVDASHDVIYVDEPCHGPLDDDDCGPHDAVYVIPVDHVTRYHIQHNDDAWWLGREYINLDGGSRLNDDICTDDNCPRPAREHVYIIVDNRSSGADVDAAEHGGG